MLGGVRQTFRVAGEVTDDMLGSAERWFGIDDLVLAK